MGIGRIASYLAVGTLLTLVCGMTTYQLILTEERNRQCKTLIQFAKDVHKKLLDNDNYRYSSVPVRAECLENEIRGHLNDFCSALKPEHADEVKKYVIDNLRTICSAD